MKYSQYLILSLIAFTLMGCSKGYKTNSDYDSSINFQQFKTYSWQQGRHGQYRSANDIVDKRVRENIDANLQSKGYTKVTHEAEADFLINYGVTTENRTDIRSYNTNGGYAPGFNYYGAYGTRGSSVGIGYSSGSDTRTIHYKQGTLVIDVILPPKDELIWRGMAEGKMSKKQHSADEREAKINEIISDTMSTFPPQ